MVKSEFSETQFFVSYLREAFNDWDRKYGRFLHRIHLPSTSTEFRSASDIILKYGSGRYKYSVFYQFKRSNFYNYEKIQDIAKRVTIDTGANPSYGFKIYNKSTTKQFNVLQLLARLKRNEVYYCAPLFHTIAECRNHFRSGTILSNSKLIDFKDPSMSAVRIPLDSNHRVIFDRTKTYVCSDIQEVKGYIAKERLSELDYEMGNDSEECFNELVTTLRKILSEEEFGGQATQDKIDINNLFYLREELAAVFNVGWFPIFDKSFLKGL